jgi:type 1 glutamine amidotransferase
MAAQRMTTVTEVAPYLEGPAGVHQVLEQASVALGELARMAGLEHSTVRSVAALEPAELEQGGILSLFTIGETPWSEEQRRSILGSVRSGRLGVLGIHAATDSCHGWDEYGSLLGARFDGHPWTQELEVEVVDREHPSTRHLGPRFRWLDEVYTFKDLRPDAHVLLRAPAGQLDMSVKGAHLPAFGLPLAWCFEEGRGRCFYTSLGHFPAAWENPSPYLRHLAGALEWLLEGQGAGGGAR